MGKAYSFPEPLENVPPQLSIDYGNCHFHLEVADCAQLLLADTLSQSLDMECRLALPRVNRDRQAG